MKARARKNLIWEGNRNEHKERMNVKECIVEIEGRDEVEWGYERIQPGLHRVLVCWSFVDILIASHGILHYISFVKRPEQTLRRLSK